MKFKVWDKIIKTFLIEEWNFLINQQGELCFFKDGKLGKTGDNFTPVFSTGLKDKNGVEIYEGDIVQSDKNCLFFDGYETGSVTSENGMFVIRSSPLYIITNHFNAEIIGNIHQNPELLK